ncbi:MAG: hypothetical protein ACHQ16_07790 [Candidatus Lutacidiplasmatales archaeon]
MAGAPPEMVRPVGVIPPLPPLDPMPTTRVPGGVVWVPRRTVGSIYLFAALVGATVLPLTNLVVASVVTVGGVVGDPVGTPPLPWIWVVVGSFAFIVAGGITSAAFDVRKIGFEASGVHFASTLETWFVPWTAFRRPVVDQGWLGATLLYVRETPSGVRTTWIHLPHDQAAALASHPTFPSWPFVANSRGPSFERAEGRYHA